MKEKTCAVISEKNISHLVRQGMKKFLMIEYTKNYFYLSKILLIFLKII